VLLLPWISLLYTAPSGGQLYQSSMIENFSDLDTIRPNLITDLAGMDANIPHDIQQFLYCYFPLEDGPLPKDLETLYDLATLGARFIKEGRTVLSHCAAGINRSSLLDGWILYLLGVAMDQALIDLIRQQRPGALTNQSFVNFLIGLPDTYNHTMDLRR
jgi:protein-tyrosine phosphatase